MDLKLVLQVAARFLGVGYRMSTLKIILHILLRDGTIQLNVEDKGEDEKNWFSNRPGFGCFKFGTHVIPFIR